MKETTQLPIWLIAVLTIVPALITGGAAVLTAWVAGGRKAAGQLEHWRRREEAMRILRWAADKSTSDVDEERFLALSVLDAPDGSKPAMLQPEDQGILNAVLAAALDDTTAAVERYSKQDGTYEVEVADDG